MNLCSTSFRTDFSVINVFLDFLIFFVTPSPYLPPSLLSCTLPGVSLVSNHTSSLSTVQRDDLDPLFLFYSDLPIRLRSITRRNIPSVPFFKPDEIQNFYSFYSFSSFNLRCRHQVHYFFTFKNNYMLFYGYDIPYGSHLNRVFQ